MRVLGNVLCCTVLALISPALALRLPEYIQACKADKTLNSCALKHGQAAISKFINGDAKYRVPKLEPMLISKLVINQGTQQVGLRLTLKDCYIHGLSRARFLAARIDLEKRHVEWDFYIPLLKILGGYKASGKILILPIIGDGAGNITLTDMQISFQFDYDLEKRKGEDYVKIYKSKLIFDTSRMYVHMDNLFNGDKLLGDAMNRFLDENWREVVEELGPSVGDAIGSVFRLIFANIASLVPYKYIFLQ